MDEKYKKEWAERKEIIKWIAIEDKFPDSPLGAYFISGHVWFGIGIWENGKKWTKGFIGEWPYGDKGDFIDKHDFLNEELMWWAEIIDYPYYGKRMGDLS